MSRKQIDWFEDWEPTPADQARMEDAIPKTRERLRVAEVAKILDVTTQHVYNLILDGTLLATNIARNLDTRPDYRVFTSSIRSFLLSRCEGAKSCF